MTYRQGGTEIELAALSEKKRNAGQAGTGMDSSFAHNL